MKTVIPILLVVELALFSLTGCALHGPALTEASADGDATATDAANADAGFVFATTGEAPFALVVQEPNGAPIAGASVQLRRLVDHGPADVLLRATTDGEGRVTARLATVAADPALLLLVHHRGFVGPYDGDRAALGAFAPAARVVLPAGVRGTHRLELQRSGS